MCVQDLVGVIRPHHFSGAAAATTAKSTKRKPDPAALPASGTKLSCRVLDVSQVRVLPCARCTECAVNAHTLLDLACANKPVCPATCWMGRWFLGSRVLVVLVGPVCALGCGRALRVGAAPLGCIAAQEGARKGGGG